MLTSPVGVASYPHLTKPDTKFNPGGTYKVDLVLDGSDEAVVAMLAKIDAVVEKSYADAAAPLKKALSAAKTPKDKAAAQKKLDDLKRHAPYEAVTDDDNNDTGQVKISTSMKATVTRKDKTTFTQKPALFDAKGNPTKASPWSGSKLAVSFEVVPFFMSSTTTAGASLRLKAAQIIELVSGGAGDADSYGFGSHDGGFEDGGEGPADGGETAQDDGAADDGSGNF